MITNSGSGGSEIWKFKGIKSGLDTIKMGYTRPWKPHDLADFKMIVVRVK